MRLHLQNLNYLLLNGFFTNRDDTFRIEREKMKRAIHSGALLYDPKSFARVQSILGTLLTIQGGVIEVSSKPRSGKSGKEGAVIYLAVAEKSPSALKSCGRNISSAIAVPKCMSQNTYLHKTSQTAPRKPLHSNTLWLQTPLIFCPSSVSNCT